MKNFCLILICFLLVPFHLAAGAQLLTHQAAVANQGANCRRGQRIISQVAGPLPFEMKTHPEKIRAMNELIYKIKQAFEGKNVSRDIPESMIASVRKLAQSNDPTAMAMLDALTLMAPRLGANGYSAFQVECLNKLNQFLKGQSTPEQFVEVVKKLGFQDIIPQPKHWQTDDIDPYFSLMHGYTSIPNLANTTTKPDLRDKKTNREERTIQILGLVNALSVPQGPGRTGVISSNNILDPLTVALQKRILMGDEKSLAAVMDVERLLHELNYQERGLTAGDADTLEKAVAFLKGEIEPQAWRDVIHDRHSGLDPHLTMRSRDLTEYNSKIQ